MEAWPGAKKSWGLESIPTDLELDDSPALPKLPSQS
jgi:hypothetical protein